MGFHWLPDTHGRHRQRRTGEGHKKAKKANESGKTIESSGDTGTPAGFGANLKPEGKEGLIPKQGKPDKKEQKNKQYQGG